MGINWGITRMINAEGRELMQQELMWALLGDINWGTNGGN